MKIQNLTKMEVATYFHPMYALTINNQYVFHLQGICLNSFYGNLKDMFASSVNTREYLITGKGKRVNIRVF